MTTNYMSPTYWNDSLAASLSKYSQPASTTSALNGVTQAAGFNASALPLALASYGSDAGSAGTGYTTPMNAVIAGTNGASEGINPADAAKTGFNWDKVGNIMQGIASLGSVIGGIQANKIAKQQLAFAKDQWNTNLTNQLATLNTAMEDRIRGAAQYSNRDPAAVEQAVTDYMNKNRLG